MIRHHQGSPKGWSAAKLNHTYTPLEAETKALLATLHQTWIRGFKSVSFDGYCDILITTLTLKRTFQSQVYSNI